MWEVRRWDVGWVGEGVGKISSSVSNRGGEGLDGALGWMVLGLVDCWLARDWSRCPRAVMRDLGRCLLMALGVRPGQVA